MGIGKKRKRMLNLERQNKLAEIYRILNSEKDKDKETLEAIKKILIELEEAKQITGWKSLFASTRWNKLSNNEQLKRIGKHIDGTVLEHNEKIMQEALKAIDDLIKHYERMKTAMKEGLADARIEDLVGIKKILEG